MEYRITEISSVSAPDGRYEIRFLAVGEPDFPFGYSHAKPELRCGKDVITEEAFDIANDGGILLEENWSVRWLADRAEVTVSGEEQPDAVYVLYYTESESR